MMKYRFTLLLTIALLCGIASFGQSAEPHYLFAYFKNNGEDGLHLAYSHDGLKWRPLNEDKPYLTPLVGSQKLMRDPCILQGPDGVFHLVWTTGWEGRDIGIAHSKDLINWSEQQTIPVMAHEPTALNCWAPEIFYDAANKQYLIFWSTTIPDKFPATAGSAGKGRNHRIYYVTTKDFKSYSQAAVFYDGGFNVIDATVVQDGQRFVMIVKDETELPTVKKHLRLATSDKAVGPYSAASPAFTKDWVEGPTVLKLGQEWIVYYDEYRDHRYGALKTRDWRTWEDVSSKLEFPKGMRHGTAFSVSAEVAARLQLRWGQALNQPSEWYASPEAVRIADNVLRWQRKSGGWPKNTDMAIVLSQAEAAKVSAEPAESDATLDNGSTHTQLRYLARVFTATQHARFKESFLKGLDYLFAAQYDNGGWPQFYPLIKGYYTHITYNDDAMASVLTLLREIARKQPSYMFVDEARRQRAEQAVAKGLECILKTQVVVDGKRTAWCAQHDEVTLAPAKARAYEHPSLSGSESVGIVRFLMGIEKPEARVVEAVEAAVAWFKAVQINGFRYVNKQGAAFEKGYDRVLEADPNAGPLWARFYEIGTNRPIFSGRDSVIKYSVAEIEHERRTGYAWYTDRAAQLLAKEYPAWRARRVKK
jgi:PelA/Pel-15E family pectate lyase